MTSDSELLARFARTRSEEDFAELLRRHVHLVYSAALRQVGGDANLAQDVAQNVFSDLARKASALARRDTLTGWLYTSARFAAAKIMRAENRRRGREEQFMREPKEAAPETDWEQLRPVLDEVMHQLPETDREAILLRYFENRPFAEIGARYGLNENTTRMRVERALEKLRGLLAKRGVTTVAALASVMSAQAVQLAPASLVATLATTSLAHAGAGTLTLWNIMNMTKLKFGLSAIVVLGASTALIIENQARAKLRAENESLTQQIARLKADNDSLSNLAAQAKKSTSLSSDQFNELLRLRGKVGMLREQTNELGRIRQENRKLLAQSESTNVVSAEDQLRLRQLTVVHALSSLLLAARTYAADHHGQYAANFDQLAASGALGVTNFPGNVGLDDFEFMKAGVVDQLGNPLIFRTRVQLPGPGGDPEWVYGGFSGPSGDLPSGDLGDLPFTTPSTNDYANMDPSPFRPHAFVPIRTSPPPNQ
jgi:RNA polymerase sigma factor (sigma-70 family)